MAQRPTTAALELGLSAEDWARVTALYNGRYATLGHDVKTVGWGSSASQALRFSVLCRGVELRGKRVLDIGCGLGDFVPWAEAQYDASFDYTGLDVSSDLVAAAQARLGGEHRRFYADTLAQDGDLGEFDVIVLSGTLTFRTQDNIGTMRTLLTRAYTRCRGVICVNFMSSYADHQLEKNFHFRPEDVFTFAKTLTPHVTLYHDYPLHEFTVQLFRQPNPATNTPS